MSEGIERPASGESEAGAVRVEVRESVEQLMQMEFVDFLNSDACSGLSRPAIQALIDRKRAYAYVGGPNLIGSDKTPYLVRDFLDDFQSMADMERIYGIGITAAKEFAKICQSLHLPFRGN